MRNKIVLVLELSDGVSHEDVIDYLNAKSLCKMHEDKGLLESWEWIY